MEVGRCEFVMTWAGVCDNPVTPCPEHGHLTCDSCGARATRDCGETMGLCCGAPLCDDCEHRIEPDGTNGGHLAHVRKADQVHSPWYTRPIN